MAEHNEYAEELSDKVDSLMAEIKLFGMTEYLTLDLKTANAFALLLLIASDMMASQARTMLKNYEIVKRRP